MNLVRMSFCDNWLNHSCHTLQLVSTYLCQRGVTTARRNFRVVCYCIRFLGSAVTQHYNEAPSLQDVIQFLTVTMAAAIAQSVYRLAADLTVRGSNSGVGEVFPGPVAHRTFYTMGTADRATGAWR